MKFSALLFVTTLLTVVRSDEVNTNTNALTNTATVSPTELLMPDIVDGISTISPSAFVTDDDWDSTFNENDLWIDEVRINRFLQGSNENVTETDEVVLKLESKCGTDCENAAAAVRNSPTFKSSLVTSFANNGLTVEEDDIGIEQTPCSTCDERATPSNRFLQGGTGTTELIITVVLPEPVKVTPELAAAVVEEPTFADVVADVAEATGGEISEPVVEVSTPSPTASPTMEPTTEPTMEPTKTSKKGGKAAKTSRPSKPPTPEPTRRPKSAKAPKGSKRRF